MGLDNGNPTIPFPAQAHLVRAAMLTGSLVVEKMYVPTSAKSSIQPSHY